MKEFFKIATLLYLTSTLFGCASLFGAKTQEVSFDSRPRDAIVYIDGKFIGNTPTKTSLAIKPEYEVTYIYNSGSESYVREFIIKPVLRSPHLRNKMLCTLDIIPGLIFIVPPFLDMASGACRGFHEMYFRAMIEGNSTE